MTSSPASEHALNVALRRVHRSVLIVLGACAVAIAITPARETSGIPGEPARGYVYAAAALGVASILTRRRVATTPELARGHVRLSLLSLLFAGGVGLVGVAAAAAGTPRNAAFLFTLAGAIFALRPPPPVLAPGPGGNDDATRSERPSNR